jgi:hypothetical protein
MSVIAAAAVAAGCRQSAATPPANASGEGAPAAVQSSDGGARAAERSSGDGAPAAAGVGERPPVATTVTMPAGTPVPIVLDTAVGSATSRREDPVRAHVARAVTVNGVTVIPEGAPVVGVVTDATKSGRVKGRAHVAVRFDSVAPRSGEPYAIKTTAVGRTAKDTKDKDALEIAGPAIGGAAVGSLIGGGKGAAIGAAAGAGAGTAIVLSTTGKEVQLAKGTPLTLKLLEPVTVRVGG